MKVNEGRSSGVAGVLVFDSELEMLVDEHQMG